jgi:hypothetical protein
MRKLLCLSLAVGLVLGLTGKASAADEAQAIIDKAIKAHTVGKVKEGQFTAYQHKAKGKVEIMGGIELTQEVFVQFPNKYKEVVTGTVNNQNFTSTTVFNGKEGWINVNGMNIDLSDKVKALLKDAAYGLQMSQMTVFKDRKKFQLELLGEVKVEGRPAVGVRVSSKGHKDISMYFDKKTGLLAKTESRTLDPMSEQEVTQEVIVREYHVVEGRKMPKKSLVNRDGKKFMEMEVTEAKLLEKFDDSEFAKP